MHSSNVHLGKYLRYHSGKVKGNEYYHFFTMYKRKVSYVTMSSDLYGNRRSILSWHWAPNCGVVDLN